MVAGRHRPRRFHLQAAGSAPASYQYLSGALGDIEVTGRQFTGFAMAGYRFVRDKLFVTVFAGLDVQDHRLTPDDPDQPSARHPCRHPRRDRILVRAGCSKMWAADVSASSVGPSYSARVAVGWRLFDAFYLGPEAAALPATTPTGNFAPVFTSPDFVSDGRMVARRRLAPGQQRARGLLRADRLDHAAIDNNCRHSGTRTKFADPESILRSRGYGFRVRMRPGMTNGQSSVRLNLVTAIVIATSISTNSAIAS